MLKAGALYFAIVITFFIAVVSASLIMVAAHYRNAWLKEVRYARLLNNINSGVAYALDVKTTGDTTVLLDLYGDGADSLALDLKKWGIYDMAVLKTFIVQDTLKKIMLMGERTNADPLAVYLSDEDRPISVSGDTRITGDGEFPKAGLRQAYAEGRPYTGKELIKGKSGNSARTLKPLDEGFINELSANLMRDLTKMSIFQSGNLANSFLNPQKMLRLRENTAITDSLSGNIILFSDTTVTIKASAKLNNIQIYAPCIKVEAGFNGSCQLFASDSVAVGNNVIFNYPSAIGVIRIEGSANQPKITLGDDVHFNGVLFSYEAERSPLQTLIQLGKETVVKGEVYSTGMLQLAKDVNVIGKVSCNRFVMRTATTLYENFLIDVTLNRKARSKYYLASGLFKTGANKAVLKWME